LGGSFVHVELDADVRADGVRRKLAGSAIAAVIHSAAQPQTAAADAETESQRTVSSARLSSPQAPTPANLVAAPEDEAADVVVAETSAKSREDGGQIRIAAKPVREGRKTKIADLAP
jgi:hypothetical protein